MKLSKTLLILFLPFLVLFACDSAEPEDEHAGEEELITRLVLTFMGGGDTVTATANDPDGDGTNLEIDTITLTEGVSYTGTIGVFDDVNDENISEEIEEEAEEHQFFFTVAGGASDRLTVEATDLDANQLPIGLSFTADVTSGAGTTGTLRVILSHFDEAPKDGVSQSDETDINVLFPVVIE